MIEQILRLLCSTAVTIVLFIPMAIYFLELKSRHTPLDFSAMTMTEKLILFVLVVVPFIIYYQLQKRFPYLRRYALREEDHDQP